MDPCLRFQPFLPTPLGQLYMVLLTAHSLMVLGGTKVYRVNGWRGSIHVAIGTSLSMLWGDFLVLWLTLTSPLLP